MELGSEDRLTSRFLIEGAMLGNYPVGDFVATVGAGHYSPILSHDAGNLTWGQQTCPTWMDQ